MSKQVNFYMTPKDQSVMNRTLRNKFPDLTYAHCESRLPVPRLSSLENIIMGTDSLSFVISLYKYIDRISFRYIDTMKYYLISADRSPVVEYDLSYFDDLE